MSAVPILLSASQLTILVLSNVQAEIQSDLPRAMVRYGLSRSVADIIAELTADQILTLAQQSSAQHVLRVAHCDNASYWTDLVRGLERHDLASVNLSLVQSILGSAPSTRAVGV